MGAAGKCRQIYIFSVNFYVFFFGIGWNVYLLLGIFLFQKYIDKILQKHWTAIGHLDGTQCVNKNTCFFAYPHDIDM